MSGLTKRMRVYRLLGVEYSIIESCMLWIAAAELATALSKAGALGVVSPWAEMSQFKEGAQVKK